MSEHYSLVVEPFHPEHRKLFSTASGVGMLKLERRRSGWWLVLVSTGQLAVHVSDDEAERLTRAMEEAGLRV